ncbi:hypothetical protein CPC08DRAFT_770282 [Agrocybe pediades]|nr:hypothetical protein CPC08DRAFT_770282 [Agrocybe pediades]
MSSSCKKYDDGLTRQQRYVQRNKAKVYAANAKYKRDKRARLRSERQVSPCPSPEHPAPAPMQNDEPERSLPRRSPSVEFEDRPENIQIRLEVEDLYTEWIGGLTRKLRTIDSHHWDNTREENEALFKGSKLEKGLYKKLIQGPKVLEGLRRVLKILSKESPDWNLTVDRLERVSADLQTIRRIFESYYVSIPQRLLSYYPRT